MISTKRKKILYGGDYNPEQWPKDVWDEDMRMFRLAGIDVATINVFSWARVQPAEDTYDFTQLDEIIEKLHANGVSVCLATGTAMYPAWMATRYPDVLPVDFKGNKRKYGMRHNNCPNSPTWRKYAQRMAAKLAERYGSHPALVVWHVNNEMGCPCYCDTCEKAFREWLRKRYGSLDELNRSWYTSFWGHTFYDWDEIVLPSLLSEHLSASHPDQTAFQAISLDYYRFNNESVLDTYRLEYDAIKAVTPNLPVTTNLHGHGTYKPLDYFEWGKYCDIIAWDNYPAFDTPTGVTAFRLDLMRGLKNGDPFMLMEQTPSQQNWQPYNSLKRPGVMRLWSYQAVARGADTVMFFQLRRSYGACEKYHGAVIEHAGHENTRVFREVAELGTELQKLGDTLLDSRLEARAAVLFDWEIWWAADLSSGPSVRLKYVDEVQKYYDAFFAQNIPVDVISTEGDLDRYDLIVAPMLYMIKPGYAEKLERFVARGGTFVTTYFSGLVGESDLVTLGGYPGELRKLLGIWVEEIDALFPSQTNRLVLQKPIGGLNGEYECGIVCDLLHTEGAEVNAVYGDDFYRNRPALTRNRFGEGSAWYLASSPEPAFLKEFTRGLCEEKGIHPHLKNVPQDVEVTCRSKDGKRFYFLLNHGDGERTVALDELRLMDLLSGETHAESVVLPAKDVLIAEQQ
ncbi:beta-galactosidase [Paenibacillus aurantius]|uniref:Beta-galactosidase n=1 Tax=Paenibacillus aurantius TaxID=2918900 RepID=A0AA96LN62_9BACL|nr:beta-galactosidase [Paenibacillus aurantius]WNQ14222.1 beta-galactosidase [Paenibacillus aurantius]